MKQTVSSNNTLMIKERMVVSHCRLKSLQYSCLEQIEFILNRLASIQNLGDSQHAIYSYFFKSNQESMKSQCIPSKYSNLLVNYLLSSKSASQETLISIGMLADTFTLDSVAVPRNNTLNHTALLPILVKFQLVSLDLSYCQFVDDTFFTNLSQLGSYPALSLKKLVLKGTKITKTNALYCFTLLECLDVSELTHLSEPSDCSSYRDHIICFFRKLIHLSELNLYATTFSYPRNTTTRSPLSIRNVEFFPPQLIQQNKIVQLDFSRSVEVVSDHGIQQHLDSLFIGLARLSSLQYLDVSFWPVALNHLEHLRKRENFLEFLGILGTNVLRTMLPTTQLNVFAKDITSLFDEPSTINCIQHYGFRRDYVNHIVNHLIEEVDKATHQFQQPDSMANAMLDLIETYYLFNKSAFPLSIHMPTFLDFTYVISRVLDKVLEHLPSSTLKRIVFDFVELARISVTSIASNNQLLLNIFTVLANFNSIDFSSYLVGYISDLFLLVCEMFSSFDRSSGYLSSGDGHDLIEISTLILSNLTWMNSIFDEDDHLSPLVQTFLVKLIDMMDQFVNYMPADPILGYLAAILMNISCERVGICRWLFSVVENLNHILGKALQLDCETVIENMCGCFEHIMNNCLKEDGDFSDWDNIHLLVENAYLILTSNRFNVDTISSTSATIIYYWYAMEKTNSIPKVTEREHTLEMVTQKISELNDHIQKNFDYVNIEAPLACLESSDCNIQYFALWVVHGCLRMDFNKFCLCLERKHMDRIYTLQFSENYGVKQKAELITALVSSTNLCF